MPGGSLSHMNMWLIATYFGGKVANYHRWWCGSFLRLEWFGLHDVWASTSRSEW